MQILVKLHGGRTRALCFDTDSVPVSLLKLHIEGYEGIPSCEQKLSCAQRVLEDETCLSGDDLLFVSLSLRVVGGKGGFGSLLRGAPSKIGQKKTDNFDACRDLSGRRMRHANNEKKLQEWIAQEKERELEKIALQHIKKAANVHTFDDQKYTNESEEIKDSISTALERGIDEAKKTSALLYSKKRPIEEESVGPFKRRQVWDDLDDIPDDEESEPETKEKKIRRSPPPFTPAPATATTTTTTTTTTSTTSTTITTDASTTQEETTISTVTSTTATSITEPLIESKPLPLAVETAQTPQTTVTPTPAITHTPEIEEPEPIDLSKYATAKDLEAIGGEALKIELQRLGLLCGGTPADRANRLFLLKTIPLHKMDKKHFAKKGKK